MFSIRTSGVHPDEVEHVDDVWLCSLSYGWWCNTKGIVHNCLPCPSLRGFWRRLVHGIYELVLWAEFSLALTYNQEQLKWTQRNLTFVKMRISVDLIGVILGGNPRPCGFKDNRYSLAVIHFTCIKEHQAWKVPYSLRRNNEYLVDILLLSFFRQWLVNCWDA